MIKDLFFGIFAEDKTSAAFKSVRRGLKGVDGAAATASDRVSRLGKSASGVAAALGGLGIANAFRGSLAAFDEQERAMAKVAQAVKSTGGAAGFSAAELSKAASALQGVTRVGDEEILDKVTAQLLTFTNIAGDSFKRAQVAALDLSTHLGGDLQGASIMLGKALNDPVRGLSAMGRAGIQFSEDQKAVIKALAETGDIAGAQGVILDELAKQYGGQAEAAAKAGMGSLDQLSNAWGDVKEEVGKVIADLLPPITSFFKSAVDGFQLLSPEVKKFIVIGGGLVTVIGPAVAALGALTVGLGAISAPLLAAGAGIATLTAGVVAFWPEIKKTASAVVDGFGAALDGVKGFVGWVTGASGLGSVVDYMSSMVSGIKDQLGARLGGILDGAKSAISSVGDYFYQLYDDVVGHSWVPDLIDGVGQHFGRLPAEMVEPAQKALSSVGGFFKEMAANSVDVMSTMVQAGEFSMRKLGDALVADGQRIAQQMESRVWSQMRDGINSALTSNSGSSLLGGAHSILSGGAGGGIGGLLTGLGQSLFSALPGFNNGADFVVGGRAGIDRNITAFRASAGERVTVTKRGAPAPAGGRVVVNIHTPNPAAFQRSRAQVSAQIAKAVARGNKAM